LNLDRGEPKRRRRTNVFIAEQHDDIFVERMLIVFTITPDGEPLRGLRTNSIVDGERSISRTSVDIRRLARARSQENAGIPGPEFALGPQSCHQFRRTGAR
jgi:hypothetical protein